jgi:polyphosphate kinase
MNDRKNGGSGKKASDPHGVRIDVDELPKEVLEKALTSGGFPYDSRLSRQAYSRDLKKLQIELVKLLNWVRREGERVVILFEGRDAAGKGGTIARLTEHLNPRSARIVALPKPSEAESGQWYFQRYIEHLPTRGEIAIFDRSWYNRAGVEPVFGFCTPAQTDRFLAEAPPFEQMLARDGLRIVKFFLTIGRETQMQRLHARWHSPLNRWKLSDLDFRAIEKWNEYSAAFERMLSLTDSAQAPWTVVRANDKRRLRLEVMRHILNVLPYAKKDEAAIGPVDHRICISAATFLGTGGEEE